MGTSIQIVGLDNLNRKLRKNTTVMMLRLFVSTNIS